VVTGSRQTGKSTLVRMPEVATNRSYRTLDELELVARAREEPESLLRTAGCVTLDEVQRSPELLMAVKRSVDQQRAAGRYLLTGSANLLLMRRVAESLAGRAVYFTLYPMTRREQLGLGQAGIWRELFDTPDQQWLDLVIAQSTPEEDWRSLARRGGYPTPALELDDQEARSLWFGGYTQTYLERDLRDVASVASLIDFRRLMRAVCLRIGNVINQTEVGRDVGLSQSTIHRHLGVLDVSYQLVRVPAYSVNRTKRLIKAPKMYWSDTGLAMHLAGESAPRGAHLENLVLSDMLAWRGSLIDAPQILYWRTSAGDEVDLVIEWKGQLLPVEVKASGRPKLSDIKSLRTFRQEYPDMVRTGLLLHTGQETCWLAEGILAAPWWRVL